MNNTNDIALRISETELLIKSLLNGNSSPADVIGQDNLETDRYMSCNDIAFVANHLYSIAHFYSVVISKNKALKASVLALGDEDGRLFDSKETALASCTFKTAIKKIVGKKNSLTIEPLYDGFAIVLY